MSVINKTMVLKTVLLLHIIHVYVSLMLYTIFCTIYIINPFMLIDKRMSKYPPVFHSLCRQT